MIIDKVSFVADQLRSMAPSADWNMTGHDRATELAKILVRANITDLWRLKFIRVDVERIEGPYEGDAGVYQEAFTVIDQGFAFEYDGRRIGYLGTPDRAYSDPALKSMQYGPIIAWSAEGHGHVGYVVRPNAAKTSLEFAPVWGSSSDAGDIRTVIVQIIVFYVSMVLPMAGVAVGQAIGNAVVPAAFAAAYPGLTTAIGNVALSAVLNGGDIKQAVSGAALAMIGGYGGQAVGGFAQAATDSALIGSLANVATRAAIMGGNIGEAVAFDLVNKGLSMNDAFGFDLISTGNAFDTGGSVFGNTFDYDQTLFTGDTPWSFDTAFMNPFLDFDFPSFDPVTEYAFDFTDPNMANAFDIQFEPFGNDLAPAAAISANNGGPAPAAPSNPTPPNSPAWNPTSAIKGITDAALAALSIVRAYRSLDNPTIQPTSRVARPDGSTSIITSNGLIQTKTAAGTVSVARPPVGVPQATVDGNWIVNNGDNTFSVVSPNGQQTRYSYEANSSKNGAIGDLLSNPMILGAGAIIGVLVLTRR